MADVKSDRLRFKNVFAIATIPAATPIYAEKILKTPSFVSSANGIVKIKKAHMLYAVFSSPKREYAPPNKSLLNRCWKTFNDASKKINPSFCVLLLSLKNHKNTKNNMTEIIGKKKYPNENSRIIILTQFLPVEPKPPSPRAVSSSSKASS